MMWTQTVGAQIGYSVERPRRFSGAPTCATCTILFDTVFRVAGAAGPQSIARMPSKVLRDGSGQIYVLADILPRVFDSTGRFVRDLGRHGAGPGEFRAISAAAVCEGDTVVFYDVELARLSYFHASGRFVRSVTVPSGGIVWSLSSLPDGSIVAMGNLSARNRLLPVHIIDPNGRARASFGPAVGAQEQSKTIAVDRRGVIVVAHIFTHEFDHYDTAGTLRGRFVIDADWFPRTTEWPAVAPGGPPPRVFIQRMDLAADGRLWVYSRVPRSDWERGLRRAMSGRGYVADPVRSGATRIEVVDIAAGQVLVSQTVPFFLFPLSDGYIAAYTETQEGYPELIVMRYRLAR